MYNKRWIYSEVKQDNEEVASYLKEKYGVPDFALKLCLERGITSPEKADAFFTPGLCNLNDPFGMKGMDEATERIAAAVDNGEVITIYGDYDADGITATTILLRFLTAETENKIYFKIPDRLSEGYGVSKEAIEEIAGYGTNLIITVDCGIKSAEEIEYAKELGMDVVVTDHHTRGDILPDCCAVINPVLEPEDSPFCNLSGAGVAFKLCEALGSVFGSDDETIYGLLPYAATGTIGDAVPLVGENRVIALCGLEYMRNGYSLGLKTLAAMDETIDPGKMSARNVSYSLIPKINAAGRMGDAARALELLTTEDYSYARKMAEELTRENINRKEAENFAFTEALKKENTETCDEDSIVIALGEGWHQGVVGIVAAKLAEKFDKPAFVFAYKKDDANLVVGSARSVAGFDLREALNYSKDCLVRYGGHEMAAGLTVERQKIKELIDKLNEYDKIRKNERTAEVSSVKVDGILTADDVTPNYFEKIKMMEPFGTGNPEPLFCINNLTVCDVKPFGEGKHVRLSLAGINGKGERILITGKKFNCDARIMPVTGETVSVLFKTDINEWQGRKTAELLIEDIFENRFEVSGEKNTSMSFYLTREKVAAVFALLRASGGTWEVRDLTGIREKLAKSGKFLTRYDIVQSLAVLRELGFGTVVTGLFTLKENPENKSLGESELFVSLSE